MSEYLQIGEQEIGMPVNAGNEKEYTHLFDFQVHKSRQSHSR